MFKKVVNKISIYKYQKNINFISFFTIILIFIILSFLRFNNINLYIYLNNEDSIIENIGALFLFFTSISLITIYYTTDKKNYLYLLAAIAFFLAAGEEISWGQRILGISTPDTLKAINDQNEFNFHNINKKFFDRLYDNSMALFVAISSLLLIIRKKKFLFSVKLPSFIIILCFILTLSYRNHANLLQFEAYHIGYLFSFILLFYFIKTKNKIMIIFTLFTVITIFSIMFTYYYNYPSFIIKTNGVTNYPHETRESLFSFVCFVYSLEILATTKKNIKELNL